LKCPPGCGASLAPAVSNLSAIKMLFEYLVTGQIAAHEPPRTTKLYDRRADKIALEEIERIRL